MVIPQVDREALDEEVHGLDFLVDSARRICAGSAERCGVERHGVEHGEAWDSG